MSCGPIVPIEIVIVIDDVDDQIAAGWDQIKVERSTRDENGPFTEITDASTRLVLVAGQTTYTYTDEEGSGSYWYRYRLFNSGAVLDDNPSEPQLGEQDPALDVMNVEELKTYFLFGLDLTNDQGEAYPDTLYAHFIKGAVSWLEDRLDIKISRTVYEDERHDFYRDDYDKYIWLKTFNTPVISVEEVSLVLPGESPQQVFSKDWIHLQRHSGQIQLVAGAGSSGTILFGLHGTWWPVFYRQNKFVPSAFRISYTAGFGRAPVGSYGFAAGSEPASVSNPDPDLDKVPHDIKELVGKIASFGPLNIAGDLLGGAGIASQSISIDGLSQSFNTTSSATSAGYGSRLIQYSKEIKEKLPVLQAKYRGLRAIVA